MEWSLFISVAILSTALKVNADVVTGNKPKISNVSHTEYDTKMKMILDAVKGTTQDTVHTVILPTGTENQGTGNELIKFYSNLIPRAAGYTLRMFVSGATQVTVYQIGSDGKETEIGKASLAMGSRWVGVHLAQHPAEELVVRVSCDSGCQVQHVKLNMFSRMKSGERALHTESHKCSPDKKDNESQCCIRHKEVNVREMGIVADLEGPVWIDFGYCVGDCPFNFNYGTEHARLRHLVERSRNLTSRQDPCLPSKYGSIKALINEGDVLEIKLWENFFAKSCACF